MRRLAALVVLAPIVIGRVGPAHSQDACPAIEAPPLILPHVRDAVAHNHDVTIVAVGSSSTEGVHASDIAHSYPAVLQRSLNSGVPTAHFAVLNRGIGGQDVSEELPRLGRDALAVRPTLIIWQVGANGAMEHLAPPLFKRLLTGGVSRLVAANVDVVLMDNQRAPAIMAAPQHAALEEAMAEVATETGVGLFSRGTLMDRWRDAGEAYDHFISDDGVHHNDRGYHCIAAALASAIIRGIDKSPLPAQPRTR